MKKILFIFTLSIYVFVLFARDNGYIRMRDNSIVHTAEGTIYKVFPDEVLELDSNGNLKVFSGTPYTKIKSNLSYSHPYSKHSISDVKEYDAKSHVFIRKDNDSLFIKFPNVGGSLRLIDQTRNNCFATISQDKLGYYCGFSLKENRLDSNSVLRIAPYNRFSFIIKCSDIKNIIEHVDTVKYLLYDFVTTKVYNNDTINTYCRSVTEPYSEPYEVGQSRGCIYHWIYIGLLCLCGFVILILLFLLNARKKKCVEKNKKCVEKNKNDDSMNCDLEKRLDQYKKDRERLLCLIEKLQCELDVLRHKNHMLMENKIHIDDSATKK